MNRCLHLIALFLFFVAVFATYGLDVSTSISTADFECLKTHNMSFVIVRCFRSNGEVDPNCPSTIDHAWSGGMSHVDGYLFPCFKCGNPEDQMQKTIEHMSSVNYGMIWLDIEAADLWGTKSENEAFLKKMIAEGKAKGVSIGIYANWNSWAEIMGSATFASDLPIWYPHYDNSPSFSDFKEFGGWHTPSIKQFRGTNTVCGAGIDNNYY